MFRVCSCNFRVQPILLSPLLAQLGNIILPHKLGPLIGISTFRAAVWCRLYFATLLNIEKMIKLVRTANFAENFIKPDIAPILPRFLLLSVKKKENINEEIPPGALLHSRLGESNIILLLLTTIYYYDHDTIARMQNAIFVDFT